MWATPASMSASWGAAEVLFYRRQHSNGSPVHGRKLYIADISTAPPYEIVEAILLATPKACRSSWSVSAAANRMAADSMLVWAHEGGYMIIITRNGKTTVIVSRRLHAGNRSVGNQDRPLCSLGIGAHLACHAWGHNIGTNTSASMPLDKDWPWVQPSACASTEEGRQNIRSLIPIWLAWLGS